MTAIPVRRPPPSPVTPDPDTWELTIDGSYAARGPVISAQDRWLVQFETTHIARRGDRMTTYREPAEVYALARLMFASAKLLAACRAMVAVEFVNERADTQLHAALKQIRAAIAAAEDKSPIPLNDRFTSTKGKA